MTDPIDFVETKKLLEKMNREEMARKRRSRLWTPNERTATR
jgi:hypothetical protein